MTEKRKSKGHIRSAYRGENLPIKLNILTLIAFSVLIIWGSLLVREKLLQNTQEMGTSLAKSYADEEQNRIDFYSMLMEMGTEEMDERILAGADSEELQAWLIHYYELISAVLQAEVVDPYVVFKGKIVGAVPWEGDEGYDYENTQWYQKADANQGKVIFTDSYQDAIIGESIITIAQKSAVSESVLAFDISMDNFHINSGDNYSRTVSYFLYDSKGTLMYYDSALTVSGENLISYTERLQEEIESGKLENYADTITDLEGEKRGVYYYYMDNGWLSVVTIPVNEIFYGDFNGFFIVLTIICIALFLGVLAVIITNVWGNWKMKRISETIRILSDSYYGIYRINFVDGTYETVKCSEDVKEQVGKKGKYDSLMQVLRTVVDENIYQEFSSSFSVENIRRLVEEKNYDFGGDYKRKFGDVYKWVNVRIIYDESLNLNEVILCFREVDTEKKQQLSQYMLLETSLQSAQKSAQEKNMFFSSVSHDMRTPLNAVIGLAKLAQKNKDDREKVDGYMAKIEKSGEQLLTLINDILDMSKIEQGEAKTLEYQPMNLRQCVEECAAMFGEQASEEKKELRVTWDIRDQQVLGDSFRIGQILNNLISNAIKYSLPGAVVEVNVKQTAGQGNCSNYQIGVKDTGIGMSEEFLDKIFEPFTRETRFAPFKATGTGLGMPIVKNLVNQMGGEITVESRLGEGSLFTVTIPFQTLEKNEEEKVQKEEKQENLEGKTILLAEDNEINMEIAAEFLKMMGIRVIQAWNGEEAVEAFSLNPPGSVDAILMDMQMPKMDGCEAARRIRQLDRPDGATVPIIAVTANAFAEDIAKTASAGMNSHISKPLDFQMLQQVLKEYIQS